MTKTIIAVLLILSTTVSAQLTEFANYGWNTFPQITGADTVKAVNGSVITLERRISEIYPNKEDVFEEISVFHRKIRVESHDAINSFNKIYIPLNGMIDILDIRARFIAADGKITELPKESIRQIENLENQGNYQTFAIEGAEAGGEIEYFYTLRKKYNPYGSVTVQGSEPRSNVEVILSFPSKLEYLVKGYNGFPDFTTTKDSAREITRLTAKTGYIPALESESYSAYDASLMRYEFTLAYNNYNSSLRVYSFSKISDNIYNGTYLINKKETAAVNALLKKYDLEGLSGEKLIWTIENLVKTEIAVSEDMNSDLPLDQVIKYKQTDSRGVTRLLMAMFTRLGINFNLVLTCDQENKAFDPDFQGWNFMNDFVIYFPEFNKIILPDNPSYRIGIVPSNYQGSYGLFLHPISYGEKLKTLAWEIRKLPAMNNLQNLDTMQIKIRLNFDRMNLEARIRRVFTGELASGYQNFWPFINEDRQHELMSQTFNMGDQNTTLNSWNLKNSSPNDIAINPLEINVDLIANALVEQAGNDIIIKIGETIGQQVELYQPKPRVLPIVMNELHNYYRRIEFEIPEGYRIAHPEDLNMTVEMKINDRISCSFTSDYEIRGNLLTLYSREYYNDTFLPVQQFEDFRKVINAAADFNKKTIVLTKSSL